LKETLIPKFDKKIAVLTIASVLLIIGKYYYSLTRWDWADETIFYLLIPLFITIFVFRESPREYGFRLGDWKMGLVLTVGGIVLMTPILWLLVRSDSGMRQYYAWMLPGLPWITFADLFGWEFLFRGWLLFGYEKKYGGDALWLQSVPFALAHLGKPGVETLSTIFGGFAFGWVAWKTRSFLYPFLIHWYIETFVILAAAGVLG
jgi:membrane protease YdiL (CAAX protease family)